MCIYIIQLCSGIPRGRVLNKELYVQRLQKLIYLHLVTDCFMKIFLQIIGTNIDYICSYDWKKIFMR